MPNDDFGQQIAYVTLVYGSKRGVSEVTNTGNRVVVTWDYNTVEWYSSTKMYQCNELDKLYYWVVIG